MEMACNQHLSNIFSNVVFSCAAFPRDNDKILFILSFSPLDGDVV